MKGYGLALGKSRAGPAARQRALTGPGRHTPPFSLAAALTLPPPEAGQPALACARAPLSPGCHRWVMALRLYPAPYRYRARAPPGLTLPGEPGRITAMTTDTRGAHE